MEEIESKLLPAVVKYLENRQLVEVAKAVAIVDKEIYRIEEEARRLRLTGELDLEVCKMMTVGYRTLADKIMALSYHHNVAKEVATLNRVLRFSNEIAGTYLQEYVRSLEEQDHTVQCAESTEVMKERMPTGSKRASSDTSVGSSARS